MTKPTAAALRRAHDIADDHSQPLVYVIAAALPQWQPIETAPTWVQHYEIPRQSDNQSRLLLDADRSPIAVWFDWETGKSIHWMPLPEPPAK